MTTRYTQEQIEDVAEALHGLTVNADKRHFGYWNAHDAAEVLADLFAADNPPECYVDGEHTGKCDDGCLRDGFNRDRFLAACGLES